MPTASSRRLLFTFFLLPFAFSAAALADGLYKPAAAVPANPKIPTQRALIVFKDNTETLVVESAFDTPSDKVGWILPLPSEPTKIAPADPTVLSSLSLSLRPYIATHSHHVIPIAIVLLFFTSILAWAAYLGHRELSVTRVALISLLLVVLLVSIFLPSLGRSSPPLTAILSSAQTVGHYTVSVLHAQTSDALNTWLTQNNLAPLTAPERTVADDYIKNNWCFAVAVLNHDPATGQLATPHPLAATFTTQSPIYPMKLTAQANSDIHVDLFVAAPDQYAADWFDTTAAATFTTDPATDTTGPALISDAKNMTIGHPDAQSLIPSGSIITRLTADLPVKAMDHDITFTASDYVPYRQYFALPSVRLDRTIAATIAFACLPAGWLGLVRRNRRPMPPPDRSIFRILLLLTPFTALCTWLYTPVTDAQVLSPMSGNRASTTADFILDKAQTQLTKSGPLPTTLPSTAIAALNLKNPYTDQPITLERSPGNLSLRAEGGTTYLCTYDLDSREYRLKLPSTQPTTP